MSYPINNIGCRTLNTQNNAAIGGNLNVTGTTTLAGRLPLTNMPIGSANQILRTNSTANGAEYVSNLPAATITPGTNGQFFTTTGGVATFSTLGMAWGEAQLNMNAQNYNSAATTALTFSSLGTNQRTNGLPVFANFTQSAPGSSLLCNTTGTYAINVNIALSNAAIGSSQVGVRLLVGGVATGPLIYSTVLPSLTTGTNYISGTIYVLLAATQIISFRAERVQGTGVLTSVTTDSYITINLISTAF